ncbi:MAG: hypothetical protein AB7G93_17810 [Bdellovibrionales bacterium]
MMLLLFSFLSVATAQIHSRSLAGLREDSRQILRERLCGVCHIPPGVERALRVFNLNNESWTALMSDRQMAQIKWRIVVDEGQIREQRGDPKKHQFTQAEIDTLIDFVESELRHRNPAQSLFNR